MSELSWKLYDRKNPDTFPDTPNAIDGGEGIWWFDSEVVIAVSRDGSYHLAVFTYNTYGDVYWGNQEGWVLKNALEVVAWMPLPKPPKEVS